MRSDEIPRVLSASRDLKRYVRSHIDTIAPAVYTWWVRSGRRCVWVRLPAHMGTSRVMSASAVRDPATTEAAVIDEYDPEAEGVVLWYPESDGPIDGPISSRFGLPQSLRQERALRTFARKAGLLGPSTSTDP